MRGAAPIPNHPHNIDKFADVVMNYFMGMVVA
jgi:hypothetical protein